MDRHSIIKKSFNTPKIARLIAKSVDVFIVLILSMLFYPFGLLLSLFYIGICDAFVNGQSVGKKIVGFRVISLEDGHSCSIKQSLIRNLPILVPMSLAMVPFWGWIFSLLLGIPLLLLEIYFIFKLDSGHRLGDVMADTTVIGNDPDHVDLESHKESWFDKNMSPVNRSMM